MPYKFNSKTIRKALLLERACSFLFFLGREPTSKIKKILLLEPFQLGDVVSLSIMLNPLIDFYGTGIEIFLLVKTGNDKLFLQDNRIKGVVTTEFPWSDYGDKKGSVKRWRNLFKAIRGIRKQKFDLGIDTRGDIRSQILMYLMGCRNRLGYISYMDSNMQLKGRLLTHIASLPNQRPAHRYDWNLNILRTIGINDSQLYPVHFPSIQYPITRAPINSPYILVHIGGGWKYKRWNEHKWTQLIDCLLNQYQNFKIIVIAGPGEADILERVKVNIPLEKDIRFLVTSFDELINYIQYSSLFIGLDSGPMNIAVCLDKKVIALFGPGDSDMWYPYNLLTSRYIHKKELPCIPCFQTVCSNSENSCMNRIEVNEVFQLVQKLL